MKKLYTYIFIPCLVVGLSTVTACSGETNAAEENEPPEQEVTEVEQHVTEDVLESELNINTASEEALRTIPNVGDKMVYEFKEYRPYVSIREFRKEIGKYVDESRVSAYEKYIYVPVSYNKSDIATLVQIPGLGNNEAEKLVSNRPYKSRQAFVEALSSYINEQQMQTAKSYLKDVGAE